MYNTDIYREAQLGEFNKTFLKKQQWIKGHVESLFIGFLWKNESVSIMFTP